VALDLDLAAEGGARILEPVLDVVGLEGLLVAAARERVERVADAGDLVAGGVVGAREDGGEARDLLLRVEGGALPLAPVVRQVAARGRLAAHALA